MNGVTRDIIRRLRQCGWGNARSVEVPRSWEHHIVLQKVYFVCDSAVLSFGTAV